MSVRRQCPPQETFDWLCVEFIWYQDLIQQELLEEGLDLEPIDVYIQATIRAARHWDEFPGVKFAATWFWEHISQTIDERCRD